jgi:radical SAM enzyme (TIGR01210 family)
MGKKKDPVWKQRPEALWKEKDQIDGRTVEAMVLILRTSGCKWYRDGGCLMCGYHSASEEGIGIEDLRMQIGSSLERYDGEEMVKIYTSGSFLDKGEIPVELRGEVFEAFSESQRVLFESRPEFVSIGNLEGIELERAQVAIGLETSNDLVRETCVNKGFTFQDYEKAASLLLEKGIPLRTYLLLKPPFLSEREAIRDAISSIEDSSPFSESISINPVNVQRDTLVERLWRRGDYRPPWWWSLSEVLSKGLEVSDTRILSAPSGAGTPRGIHNCGECDDKFIEAVRRFSFEQDLEVLRGPRCDCREEWKALVDVQDIMGTSVDVSRYLSSSED